MSTTFTELTRFESLDRDGQRLLARFLFQAFSVALGVITILDDINSRPPVFNAEVLGIAGNAREELVRNTLDLYSEIHNRLADELQAEGTRIRRLPAQPEGEASQASGLYGAAQDLSEWVNHH